MVLLVSWPNRKAMQHADGLPIGYLQTPKHFVDDTDGRIEAADNMCFSNWDERAFVRMLERGRGRGRNWKFVAVPDVVGDHAATMERWAHWSPIVRSYGHPVAFVCQDGATVENMPWGEIDAIFLGGTDAFKLGEEARRIVRHAKSLGMWSHMGRVNSIRRMRIAIEMGVDSVDGSGFARFPKYLLWGGRSLRDLNLQPLLGM